jgi:hypothetical protein
MRFDTLHLWYLGTPSWPHAPSVTQRQNVGARVSSSMSTSDETRPIQQTVQLRAPARLPQYGVTAIQSFSGRYPFVL